MTDITSLLNELLKRHEAHLNPARHLSSSHNDGFLKEAYSINAHISAFSTYLRSVRHSYLSTSPPSHRRPLSRTNSSTSHSSEKRQTSSNEARKYLTDRQRDEIDANAKSNIKALGDSIVQLNAAEQTRQAAELEISRHKPGAGLRGFGALQRWAAGDSERVARSPEEELEDTKRETVKVHRKSIIEYLQNRLNEVSRVQLAMMETRKERQMEKSKSVLYKTKGSASGFGIQVSMDYSGGYGEPVGRMDEESRKEIERQLSPEQLQLFEEENQTMLKHYHDQLDQIRVAERSMNEISELQAQMAQQLETQAVQVDQLVTDSLSTTENIGGGNKQLKRAAERKSTARMVFWVSCGLSAFLIAWDLII